MLILHFYTKIFFKGTQIKIKYKLRQTYKMKFKKLKTKKIMEILMPKSDIFLMNIKYTISVAPTVTQH